MPSGRFASRAVLASAVALFALGAAGLSAQPADQAQPADMPVPPPPSGPPGVASPEPAPNPVREMREENSGQPDAGAGGLDPELGPIAEPDAQDIAPALRQEGDGDWERPDEDIRRKAREKAMEAAAAAAAGAARSEAAAGDGLVMPRLMAPSIPIVPLDLLFPPEIVQSGPQPVRQSRGSVVEMGTLNRDTGESGRLRIPVGRGATFGSLKISVSGCFMSHPEDTFESWAWVSVADQGRARAPQLAVLPQRDRARMREAQGPRQLRNGWVIASSPAVTPIDHPTYDVWLIRCEGDGGAPPPPQSASGTPGQAPLETQPATGSAAPARPTSTAP